MRNFINILEKWDRSVKVSGGTWGSQPGMQVDVFRNPSKTEFMKLRRAHNELRALLTHDGDLLVWDANLAIHSDIEEQYPDTINMLWLFLDKDVVIRHLEYHQDEKTDKYEPRVLQFAEMVTTNPHLKSIYGNFVPLGENNDEGDYFPLTSEWLAKNCMTTY